MVRGCVLPAQEAGGGAAAANGGAAGAKAAVRLSLRASDGGAVAGRLERSPFFALLSIASMSADCCPDCRRHHSAKLGGLT